MPRRGKYNNRWENKNGNKTRQQCSSSSRTSPTMGADLQHYWLRNAVQDLVITPAYVSLSQTVADLFTKAVQPQVVAFAVPKLGLTP